MVRLSTQKMADSAVTSGKIADGAIIASKIAPSAASAIMPSGGVIPYAGASVHQADGCSAMAVRLAV